MALFQCVIAMLVAAGVAVQPEAPVRRQRKATAATATVYVKGSVDGYCPTGYVHVETTECGDAKNQLDPNNDSSLDTTYKTYANRPRGCYFNAGQNKYVANFIQNHSNNAGKSASETGCPCQKACAGGNGYPICKEGSGTSPSSSLTCEGFGQDGFEDTTDGVCRLNSEDTSYGAKVCPADLNLTQKECNENKDSPYDCGNCMTTCGNTNNVCGKTNTLAECKARCGDGCTGIEWNKNSGRCETWSKNIGVKLPSSNHVCLRKNSNAIFN